MEQEKQTEAKETEIPQQQEAAPAKPAPKADAVEKPQGILEIQERKQNPILDREEIVAVVRATRTPTNEEAKQLLSSELKADAGLVVINNIYSSFGKQEFKINAFLYKSKETFEKLVPVRKELKEKEEKPEAKAEGKDEKKTE